MRPAARGSIVRIFKRLRGAAKRRARRLARHRVRASPGDRYFSALDAKPPDTLCLTNFFLPLASSSPTSFLAPFYLFPETCKFMHRGEGKRRHRRRSSRITETENSAFHSLARSLTHAYKKKIINATINIDLFSANFILYCCFLVTL